MSDYRILVGDAREKLSELEAETVQVCLTSPPYWRQRDFKVAPVVWGGELGCAHEWKRCADAPLNLFAP